MRHRIRNATASLVVGLAVFGLARGAGLGLVPGLALALAAALLAWWSEWRSARVATPSPLELAARVEALLPQTQCTQCGYAGCKPYAQAISRGEAGIDQCPPGGDDGLFLLDVDAGAAAGMTVK